MYDHTENEYSVFPALFVDVIVVVVVVDILDPRSHLSRVSVPYVRLSVGPYVGVLGVLCTPGLFRRWYPVCEILAKHDNIAALLIQVS